MGILIEGVFDNMKKNISIDTVANYFLSRQEMTPKKLQKICYYAYAWHLALKDSKLFEDKFEAWVHGPVNPGLYHRYKSWGWNPINRKSKTEISAEIEEFLNIIFNTFSKFSGDELEDMTHSELPWQEARAGYEPDQACTIELKDETIKSFYKNMFEKNQGE